MKNTFKTILGLGILFITLETQGQVRKYSNDFLSIGAGAKALGMGNAVVAGISDVSSGYWNPAGLLQLDDEPEFGIMHSEYFAGVAKYDFGAVALPTKTENRYVGLTLLRFGVDDIPNTLYLVEPDGSINYDNISSFSAVSYGIFFSYAQKIGKKGLNFGANFKVINHGIGSFATGWGFGLDAGLQWKKGEWNYGLVARDITSTFNAWSFNFTDEEKAILSATGNDLPENGLEITAPSFAFGVNREFQLSEKFSLVAESNIIMTTDGARNVLLRSSGSPFSLDPNIGVEIGYIKKVYLRGGIQNIQKKLSENPGSLGKEIYSIQPHAGVGINLGRITIDYALANISDFSESLYSHVIAINFKLKSKN